MVSGCLFTHLGWHLSANFSCALIKSATANEPVSSALRFLCFYCERDRQIQTERREGEGESLWWARSLALWSVTHTRRHSHHTMAFRYNPSAYRKWDLSIQLAEAPAIAQIALFCNCWRLPKWCWWYGLIAANEQPQRSDIFLLLSITFFKHKLANSWLSAINTSKVSTAS